MKKILVPTDFSDHALNAVNYAVSIAKMLHGSVTLLHTFTSKQPTGIMKSMDSILEQDANKAMDELVKQLPEGSVAGAKVLKGDPITAIARVSKDFDLVVMGTQGASGLEEVFIGSVTSGVMRETSIPILAVPCGYRFQPIQNIGFAVANLQLYSQEATNLVKELVQESKARVFVFHQSENLEAEVEVPSNLEWMGDIPYTVSIVNNQKGLDANIQDFVGKKKIGLLCMVRRNKSFNGFFERLFRESVTMSQVFRSEIPLLILHSN